MSNMSYCKWRNTYQDLRDCADFLHDDLSDSPDEDAARKKLLNLAARMLEDIGVTIDWDEVDQALDPSDD